FELDPRKKPNKLSRGKRSALGAVIGLASRAPVTMFDEAYLGMDAPSRRRFYDLLIADYVEHPRTIVVSSHLISEVEQLFENVVVLDDGAVLLAEDAETLRGHGATVTGPADRVDAATAGLRVLSETSLGPTKQVTVLGELDGATHERIRAAGLGVVAVLVYVLFMALPAKEARRCAAWQRRAATAPPPARSGPARRSGTCRSTGTCGCGSGRSASSASPWPRSSPTGSGRSTCRSSSSSATARSCGSSCPSPSSWRRPTSGRTSPTG